MIIEIVKHERRLRLICDSKTVYECRAALGRKPEGAKLASGDLRTPEGEYRICLVKPNGKYGRSLGLDYPNPADAERAFEEGRIDKKTLEAVRAARAENRRPPWGSPLGGEIYIHEGGSKTDWTAGCIALDEMDMDVVFAARESVKMVIIRK